MYSLTATKLTKRYPAAIAVDSADVALRPGRIYGLLGPNGSGKSTLMKIAAGLVRPTAGEVRVLDRPIGPSSRAHVVYMPTEPYFYGFMTVKQVGTFFADFFTDFSMETYLKLTRRWDLRWA